MKNKDSKARMQVIFGVLLFAFVMSTELYAMINYSKMYLVIAGLAVIDLVCLYVVINGLFALREMKDARNEEQYDSVFKSEKASYLMLKKYFEEIEDKLNYLEKAAKVPTEEIVNAQKGIAKVIINRNRENTEALINSNEQVMEQFTECSSTIADITKLLSAYKDEIVSEQKKTEEVNEQSIQVKMQDLLIQMKDMELRLNQAINQIQNVNYQQPMVAPTYIQQPQVNVAKPEEKPVENVQPEIEAAEKVESEIPVDKVCMIGWSYGGFLSALAVLDAPNVFKAACAGAPPTDWTLYDTHYTERYLGLDPDVYYRNGIVQDAPKLERPLMLIHGFADDNVTIAHSLRLSQALMAAGRPHTFLPLTGITHMTNDETVAENLLTLQRDFLRDALA